MKLSLSSRVASFSLYLIKTPLESNSYLLLRIESLTIFPCSNSGETIPLKIVPTDLPFCIMSDQS